MKNEATVQMFGRVIVALLCAVALGSTATAQDATTWKIIDEDWFTMEIAGAPAGYSSKIVRTDGKQFQTDGSVNMKISRGAMTIEIQMLSSIIETIEGKPVSMEMSQKMSLQNVESKWIFYEDRVEHITRQGGAENTRTLPLPEGEFLMPYVLDQFARKQRAAGVKELTFRTLDPNAGTKPITATSKRIGDAKFQMNGESVDVSVWKTSTDLMPGIETTEHVTAEGELVFQETPMAGMGNMTLRWSTKAQAMGVADAPAPELMLQSFIKPDKPINNPHESVRATLKLIAKEGTLPDLPSVASQRVQMADDRKSAVLTIDIDNPQPASAADVENKEYLASSAMIDASDPLIQKLAKRAVESSDGKPSSTDPMQRAEAIRKFVHSHISKKGMATAFASASETAKMRTGDCSEHGVLLAAMLRADGIPARVATGLVYVDAFEGEEGIFGWHMWAQALIDGKWIDFDGTLPTRFSATHVLTSTSSLEDGVFAADMAGVVRMLGNLDIEVIEVHHK